MKVKALHTLLGIIFKIEDMEHIYFGHKIFMEHLKAIKKDIHEAISVGLNVKLE